jgi:hypothetical protein
MKIANVKKPFVEYQSSCYFVKLVRRDVVGPRGKVVVFTSVKVEGKRWISITPPS